MTRALTSAKARETVRTKVFSRTYSTIHSRNEMATIREKFRAPTRQQRVEWQRFTFSVRDTSIRYSSSWIKDWTKSWLDVKKSKTNTTPTGGGSGGGGGGSSSGTDPRRLSVDRLVELLEESQNYLVHRTSNAQVGMLQAPLEARKPAPGEHPAAGVYAMRGIEGVDYGPYGIVIQNDGQFKLYSNGEWICSRDLSPDETLGWYHIDDLRAAKARRQ